MAGLLALRLDHLGADLPADHQGHQQRAQRHHDALGQHIPEVQPVGSPCGQFARHTQKITWRKARGAQRIGADQNAAQTHAGRSDEGVGLTLVALAGVAGLIHEVGHDDLQQGDGGGNGGEYHQQIEQDAEDGTHGIHAAEHVLHGDEQQLGAAQRAVGVEGEAAGNDAQTGHQSHQRIHDDDEDGVLLQVLLLLQVGAVGDHGAHAQRQGEEHLAACGSQHRQEVGSLVNDAVGDSPAGHEHVLQAVDGAVQRAGADDADQQHHEQRGHTHGADLLNTAADTADDDDHGDGHEDQTVDDSLGGIPEKCAEHLSAYGSAVGVSDRSHGVGAEARAEQVAHVQHDVLDAVAAQRAVEEQDEERGQDAHPAHPLELLGQDVIRFHSALAGLAADGQLAHHDDKAAQNCQNEVNNEERKTTGGAHFIGEAPDVAQTDGGADGSHQETKIGSKAFSFFHCFLSLTDFCPYVAAEADILPRPVY